LHAIRIMRNGNKVPDIPDEVKAHKAACSGFLSERIFELISRRR
jgi:hypothetical protein